MSGHVTRYFPGNNTPNGYFSFFDQVLPWHEAQKIFIIKGGPGAGKSTLFKKLSRELIKQDIDIELLYCTADKDSIDGLIIVGHNIALFDGTAPHVLDPKYVGCVDEIINFGELWDEEGIKQHKEKIIALQHKKKIHYKSAYNYLIAAKVILDDIKNINKNIVNHRLIDLTTDEIIDSIFKDVKVSEKRSYQRHLFASAITPDGYVNYLDSLFENAKKRFIIIGEPGTGKSTLIKRVLDLAVLKGFNADVFHCPMDVESVEHILIKDLDCAFITSVKPHTLNVIREDDVIVDLNSTIYSSKLVDFKDELKISNTTYWGLIDRAIELLYKAKTLHGQLEEIYASNMNFEKVDVIQEKILSDILETIK